MEDGLQDAKTYFKTDKSFSAESDITQQPRRPVPVPNLIVKRTAELKNPKLNISPNK